MGVGDVFTDWFARGSRQEMLTLSKLNWNNDALSGITRTSDGLRPPTSVENSRRRSTDTVPDCGCGWGSAPEPRKPIVTQRDWRPRRIDARWGGVEDAGAARRIESNMLRPSVAATQPPKAATTQRPGRHRQQLLLRRDAAHSIRM